MKLPYIKTYILTIFAALLTFSACGCSVFSNEAPITETVFAMDTVMTLQLYGKHNDAVMANAKRMIAEMENALSVTKADSAISLLNRDGTAVFDRELAALIDGTLTLCERTDGALDISIFPVMQLWGFQSDAPRVPTDAELSMAVKAVDYQGILWDNTTNTVTLSTNMALDFGAVAKGYLGDRLEAYLRTQNVESALLDLGGNIHLLGEKPDGSAFRVGIRDPHAGGTVGTLSLSDCAIVTSGIYERYFEADGVRYGHILDPQTGYPAETDLASVTVISDCGLLSDGLSTALYVMGLEHALEFWCTSDDFEAIFITHNGEIIVTDGISGVFYANSGRTVHTAHR